MAIIQPIENSRILASRMLDCEPVILRNMERGIYWRGQCEERYVRCRAKRAMKDATAVTMESDRPATQGAGLKCGTRIFRTGKG